MIGYSFGGSLAMEIAMQLRRDHRSHGRLLLLDAHLPFGLPQRGRFGKARVHLARIVEGHETSRIAYIAQRLRPTQPDPQQGADQHRDELDAYRAVSRINRQMVLEYRPSTTYDGTITLVRARQPEWLRFHRDDGHNGFSAIVDPSRIERIEIDAGHLELFNPDPATQIASVVDRWIGQP
jgi:thioesterase domain-containing protein